LAPVRERELVLLAQGRVPEQVRERLVVVRGQGLVRERLVPERVQEQELALLARVQALELVREQFVQRPGLVLQIRSQARLLHQ
jgi:hypothetical protein